MGFEPMTSAIPVQRSTNWANKPTGSWSMNWVQINIRVNEDLDIWKFTYLHCGGKMKLEDPLIRGSSNFKLWEFDVKSR